MRARPGTPSESAATTPRAADAAPSKTRLKQAMHELQSLGARLVDVPPARLAEMPLPDDLREAIRAAARITKHEARRRQLQYIGKLMRGIDPAQIAEIHEVFARWDGRSAEATRALHTAERWRDRLIDDDAALTEFARKCVGCDVQVLRAAIREVRRERAAEPDGSQRGGRRYRELFKLVRESLDTTSPLAQSDRGGEDGES